LAALKDPVYYVQWNAAKALGKIGDSRAVAALAEVLKTEPPAEVDIEDAHSWPTAEGVRQSAAVALGDIRDRKAAPVLEKAWKEDKSEIVRVAAACSLFRTTKDEAAFKFLLDSLKHEAYEVRLTAASSLGKTSDPRAIAVLVGIIGNEREYGFVLDAAADALGEMGKPAAEQLVKALDGSTPCFRYFAAWSFAKIKDRSTIAYLIEMLKDTDDSVRGKAAEALMEITGEGFGQDYARWKSWHEKNKDE
jgi:HEAT repeat protein